MSGKITDLTLVDSVTDAVTGEVVKAGVSKSFNFGQVKTWTQAWYATDTATFTNKTISGASNTVTDIPLTSLAAGILDTDGTLAANSDSKLASQKAVKTYVDARLDAVDAFQYKGVIDCSANPNYPAASAGHTYKVSVAGKIGGASGATVEFGDLLLCLVDSTASGTQAAVGASWDILNTNIDGAVIGPASSVSGNAATFSGTSGKVIQDSGKALPSGTIVGTSDSQTLTNKTISGGTATSLTSLHATKGFQAPQSPMASLMGGNGAALTPMGFSTGSSQTVTAGRLYINRFMIDADRTFVDIYLRVTTTGGNLRIGIWSDNAGSPGALIYDSGSIAVGGSGATQPISISQALSAGPVWIGSVYDATPSLLCVATAGSGQGASHLSSTFATILGYYRAFAFGALGPETGSTFTIAVAAANAPPVLLMG